MPYLYYHWSFRFYVSIPLAKRCYHEEVDRVTNLSAVRPCTHLEASVRASSHIPSNAGLFAPPTPPPLPGPLKGLSAVQDLFSGRGLHTSCFFYKPTRDKTQDAEDGDGPGEADGGDGAG